MLQATESSAWKEKTSLHSLCFPARCPLRVVGDSSVAFWAGTAPLPTGVCSSEAPQAIPPPRSLGPRTVAWGFVFYKTTVAIVFVCLCCCSNQERKLITTGLHRLGTPSHCGSPGSQTWIWALAVFLSSRQVYFCTWWEMHWGRWWWWSRPSYSMFFPWSKTPRVTGSATLTPAWPSSWSSSFCHRPSHSSRRPLSFCCRWSPKASIWKSWVSQRSRI